MCICLFSLGVTLNCDNQMELRRCTVGPTFKSNQGNCPQSCSLSKCCFCKHCSICYFCKLEIHYRFWIMCRGRVWRLLSGAGERMGVATKSFEATITEVCVGRKCPGLCAWSLSFSFSNFIVSTLTIERRFLRPLKPCPDYDVFLPILCSSAY